MVSRAKKYQWSSAAAHCGQRCDPLLSEIPLSAPHDDWRDWPAEGLPEEEHERIRRAAKRGAPYASESFLRELERLLDLRLLPRKPGPNSSSYTEHFAPIPCQPQLKPRQSRALTTHSGPVPGRCPGRFGGIAAHTLDHRADVFEALRGYNPIAVDEVLGVLNRS